MNKGECMEGGLWLTSGGRMVLDNHNCEIFTEPYDRKIMSREELEQGISKKKFLERLFFLEVMK